MTPPPDRPTRAPRDRLAAIRRSPWFQPLLGAALGIAVLVTFSLSGHPNRGVIGFALLVAFGVLLRLASRSDTIKGLRGDGRDERFELIRLRATGIAARTLVLAVVLAWFVSVAEGRSGAPYDWLAAIAGASFLLSVGVLQRRS